ncbi:alpha/beta hydrolase [Orrella sp. JC864]|uniref:alpha/beta hydrolase n=1 Tax=Orrella sp. JC864 TaxID=3120298 RepID=UPI0030091B44
MSAIEPSPLPPAIDAELQSFLALIAGIEADEPADPAHPLARRRRIGERVAQALPQGPTLAVRRQDLDCPAPGGHAIALRLYHPGPPSGTPAGLMVYFHGGGWTVGDIASHDKLCARLAHETGWQVASVDYRRAPEHPYPAPLDDCWQALQWLLAQPRQGPGAAGRPVALGGDSAGAHLALGCAMRAVQQGGPAIDRLLLFYPPVRPDTDTPSMRQFAQGPGLTAAAMRAYWQAYAGAAPADDPMLDLTRWRRLAELPPAVVMTAECDVLRDEGEAYAQAWRQAGGRVTLMRARGMTHGFARMLTASAAACAHVRDACRALLQAR